MLCTDTLFLLLDRFNDGREAKLEIERGQCDRNSVQGLSVEFELINSRHVLPKGSHFQIERQEYQFGLSVRCNNVRMIVYPKASIGETCDWSVSRRKMFAVLTDK